MSGAAPGRARLLVFLGLALAVTGSLVVYTVSHRRPPIPADLDHATAGEPSQCLRCHGPGAPHARHPSHPLNDQCFSCHERS